MICWSCGKIKGKRSCPAHGGDRICARCCGTKRRVEIACPEDCPYLHGEHDSHWDSARHRNDEARFLGYFAGAKEEQVPLLVFVHHLLLHLTRERPPHGLSDAELLEVVSTAARTYQTLSKGILYEHQSPKPWLQAVVHRLDQLLKDRDKIPEVPTASDTELAAVLEAVATAIRRHHEASANGRRYLELAERVFRPGLEQLASLELPGASPPGSLIIEP